MDNLKVFKKMGRYVTAQITTIKDGMQKILRSNENMMGLENQLIVDAWNTLADDSCSHAAKA